MLIPPDILLDSNGLKGESEGKTAGSTRDFGLDTDPDSGLLLPAIQAAREAAPRNSCGPEDDSFVFRTDVSTASDGQRGNIDDYWKIEEGHGATDIGGFRTADDADARASADAAVDLGHFTAIHDMFDAW